jgi:hypothetical protein
MPTRPDKGHTEKGGSGKTGGQKATDGSARSPEAAAEARTTDTAEESDDEG